MKFWQKIFLSTLIIFVVVFDAGVLVLTSYSYDFSRQREIDNGVREHSVILSSVESSITNAKEVFKDVSEDKDRLVAIVQPLADYYKNQGVFLALYNNDYLIYSNTLDFNQNLLDLGNSDNKNILDQKFNTERYLFIASKIPEYTNLTFVYARNITQLDDYRANISKVFLVVNVIICTLIGVSIFMLLKRMTRPINKLNTITREIANGAYDKRVNINRKDEFGELGRTFNIMADSIEENIERLKKSAEDKQQFIDNLTHEIKTPLTSVLGYSEYLQNANSNEEDRIQAVGHLHDSAMRIKNLSVKLLDLTYLRNENIEKKEIDVNALFVSLVNLVQPGIAEKRLNLEAFSEIKTIKGDETLLLSLLSNLVENAARASYENGTIIVKAYNENSPVIEVVDTGCGMNENEIDKITAPFYRVDKSRSRAFGGVGLGLSIVAQIAILHNAKMEIESTKGEGTKVKIVFTTL